MSDVFVNATLCGMTWLGVCVLAWQIGRLNALIIAHAAEKARQRRYNDAMAEVQALWLYGAHQEAMEVMAEARRRDREPA